MKGIAIGDLNIDKGDRLIVYPKRGDEFFCTVIRVRRKGGRVVSAVVKTRNGEPLSIGGGTRVKKLEGGR